MTIVDVITKYPALLILTYFFKTEKAAEALLDVFSRVDFPTKILSDKVSQFISDLMKEVCRLISLNNCLQK